MSDEPTPAQATDGDPILAGRQNTATVPTILTNTSGRNGLTVDSRTGDGTALIGMGSRGVWGEGRTGDGVFGQGFNNGVFGRTNSPSGSGVYGLNDASGIGVAGRSNNVNGTGVFGEALGPGGTALRGLSSNGGTALQVEGKAKFSRSGRKTIAAESTSEVIILAGLTADSLVLATVQQHAVGYLVESAVPSDGSFTIWLNQPAPKDGLTVAWFVIN